MWLPASGVVDRKPSQAAAIFGASGWRQVAFPQRRVVKGLQREIADLFGIHLPEPSDIAERNYETQTRAVGRTQMTYVTEG